MQPDSAGAAAVTAPLEDFYRRVVAPRIAGLPFVNPRLEVEAVGFRRWQGQWLGCLVLPWSLNLVLLRDCAECWPALAVGDKRRVAFRAGEFEFVGAIDAVIGEHHDCSLFSPVLEFVDQLAARTIALAALAAIEANAIDDIDGLVLDCEALPGAAVDRASSLAAVAASTVSRRGFLGMCARSSNGN